jgi:hypothetical protein
LGERGVRIVLEVWIAEIGNFRLEAVQFDNVGALDPADICPRATLEYARACRQLIDGGVAHMRASGVFLPIGAEEHAVFTSSVLATEKSSASACLQA